MRDLGWLSKHQMVVIWVGAALYIAAVTKLIWTWPDGDGLGVPVLLGASVPPLLGWACYVTVAWLRSGGEARPERE